MDAGFFDHRPARQRRHTCRGGPGAGGPSVSNDRTSDIPEVVEEICDLFDSSE